MKSFLFLSSVVLFSTCTPQSLPPTVKMTPVGDLALHLSKVIVPEKYRGEISENLSLSLPHGYYAKIFYTG